jgi:hypothetical protein
MKTACKEFADRLVDYVDGELPEEQAQAVARHLAECNHCRQTAEALRRSLGLAQILWQDNLGEATVGRGGGARGLRSTAVPAVSPTGILPVAPPDPHGQDAHATHGRDAHVTHGQDARATICPYGHTTNRPRRGSLYAIAAAASILLATGLLVIPVFHRPSSDRPITAEQIERQVARAGVAAELLAATRLVAQCEGTESIVEQQYRYILREYADTPAAESIKTNHNPKLGGTHHD